MYELKQGYMSNNELANWFGVTQNSFTKMRPKKLKELKDYADFEVVRGGVMIREIFEREYDKNQKSNYNKIKELIPLQWSENGIDTCRRVSYSIQYEAYGDDRCAKAPVQGLESLTNLSENTIYTYTCKGKKELFGKAYDPKGGELGKCRTIWCKKVRDADGAGYHFEPFNEEETERKNQILKNTFQDDLQDRVKITYDLLDQGLIRKEDFADKLNDLTNFKGLYSDFLRKLKIAFGTDILKATQILYYSPEELEQRRSGELPAAWDLAQGEGEFIWLDDKGEV